MKKLTRLMPLLSLLACAGETNGSALRAGILIGAGVLSVVLLILFGKPNANKKNPSKKE